MSNARDISQLGGSVVNDANNNVALGDGALDDASLSGSNNVGLGFEAGFSNTSGSQNTFVGRQAGKGVTTASQTILVGNAAGRDGTMTGDYNLGIGSACMNAMTSGTNNLALHRDALGSNTTGVNNVAVGYQALQANTTASNNTAVGYQAGYNGTTSAANTLIGKQAGYYLTTANGNTFIGCNSGEDITTGQNNTVIGRYQGNQGGLDIRTSSNNIVLSDGDGNPRGYWHGGLSSPLWVFVSPTVGQNSIQFQSTTPTGNIYGPAIQFKNQSPNDTNVYALNFNDSSTNRFRVWSNGNVVNTNNSYGSISDEKLKENIVDSGSQWDDIKALRVRKYSMKADNLDAPNMLGVIAQEVEAAGMGGLVFESPDTDDDLNDLGTVTKQVNYSILYMKAVKALQEAIDRIETLETENTAIKARLDALEAN